MLSVIIPSRVDQYLQKTIDDLLGKARGDIEVIVILDGYWPNPFLNDDPRVKVVHQGEVHNNLGMRAGINVGVALAEGDFILKADEHTMWSEGYDVQLAAACRDDWVMIPRRKRLDADAWEVMDDGRPDIDYMHVEYPYLKPFDRTQGLHGAEWRRPERADILIDDTPTMQGSAYFCKKSYWQKLFPNGMDEEHYGTFTQEAQEISMAVWFSGGEVKVHKGVWYAHFHKGRKGKGYGFSNAQYRRHEAEKEKGRIYCIEHWLNTKSYKYDFAWFINEKFPGMPNWPDDWEDKILVDKEHDWSKDPSKQPSEWL
jgi:glycosyltransferase involved in cell wall biosynthesis